MSAMPFWKRLFGRGKGGKDKRPVATKKVEPKEMSRFDYWMDKTTTREFSLETALARFIDEKLRSERGGKSITHDFTVVRELAKGFLATKPEQITEAAVMSFVREKRKKQS